ncbi:MULTISPECIES: hypothetical protein [unclassified Streptomyces]|uniref:hypothetical protein n=1 Tax=unclassified Streptomyces TaxID=2593676 RepID=UPI0022597390|nr:MULTISPECIES: hypothetical protein [unclassified Streptomyces]MCX4776841.1 hypothetical protein [Streptomyces sp. NBC_01264]WSP93691.1 hypothetical protein OG332_37345 [Streptomyces sp. NBC_01233]
MAALAAIIGTCSGAVSALGAARLNGTMQRRSQHEHWRRDGRRQAYVAFVGAAVDYGEVISIVQALDDEDRPSPEAAELYSQVVDMRRTTSKALALVLVEGPEDVARAAHQAVRALTAWACSSGAYHPGHPLAASRSVQSVLRQGPADAVGLSDLTWQRIREFETRARAALDQPLGSAR